jgi:hypothetical protein
MTDIPLKVIMAFSELDIPEKSPVLDGRHTLLPVHTRQFPDIQSCESKDTKSHG